MTRNRILFFLIIFLVGAVAFFMLKPAKVISLKPIKDDPSSMEENLRIIRDNVSTESKKKRAAGELIIDRESLLEPDQIRVLSIYLPTMTADQKFWLQSVTARKKDFFSLMAQFYLGFFSRKGVVDLPDSSKMRILDLLKTNASLNKSPDVSTWVLTEANAGKGHQLRAAAIQTLARLEIDVTPEKLETWISDSSPEVRAATMELMLSFCPQNLWSILQKVAQQEMHPLVLARAIDILPYLQGKNTEDILQKLLSRTPALSETVRNRIFAVRQDLKTTKREARCP